MIAFIFLFVCIGVITNMVNRAASDQYLVTQNTRWTHLANWMLLAFYASIIVVVILITLLLWRYLP